MKRPVSTLLAGMALAAGLLTRPQSVCAQPSAAALLATPNPQLKGTASMELRGPLTIEEVLTRVERYHPKLLGAELDRRLASAKFLEKQGAFDPVLSAAGEYLEYNSTSTPGRRSAAFQNFLSVDFLTESGVKYTIGSRLNTGSVKSPLSSTGSTGEYFVAFSLPLLRGMGINEKFVALQQAALGEPIAAAGFFQTRLELLQKAATGYWNWVAAGQRLALTQELLRFAEDRAEAIRGRLRAGDLPAIDGVEAAQEVRLREGEAIKAERELQKEALNLSLYLWRQDGTPSGPPPTTAIPTALEEPVALEPERVSEGQSLALERRPELRRLALNRDLTRLELNLAENQRLPGVDLYVSPGIDTGANSIGSTLKAGVAVSLPLAQRTADGLIAQARLKMEKFDLDGLTERQRILTEVGDAASAVDTAHRRFLVAVQEVYLARRMEQGERDRFALGDSTVFLVNQRERASASARIKQIDAQAEYERAMVAFRVATGTL